MATITERAIEAAAFQIQCDLGCTITAARIAATRALLAADAASPASENAREIVARCLTEQPAFGFSDNNRLQGADVILGYLRDAGHAVVKVTHTIRKPFVIEADASPASGDLAEARKEGWCNFNSNHQNAGEKFVYDSGFDTGIVAAIMHGKYRSASPASGGEWRTIETAPKDGTKVDLWHPIKGRCTDAFWCNQTYALYEPWGWSSQMWGRIVGATHWQPLPAPPAPIRGERET